MNYKSRQQEVLVALTKGFENTTVTHQVTADGSMHITIGGVEGYFEVDPYGTVKQFPYGLDGVVAYWVSVDLAAMNILLGDDLIRRLEAS